MSTLAGHADLAMLVDTFGSAVAREAAVLLGFKPQPLLPVTTEESVAATRTTTGGEPPPATPSEPRGETSPSFEELGAKAVADQAAARAARARFWRVTRFEPADPRDQDADPTPDEPDADSPLSREERSRVTQLFGAPPRPLVPWHRLWPSLASRLRSEVPLRSPDVAVLQRAFVQGEPLRRIPRARRRAWAHSVSVWLDRSPHLVPLWADQDRVVRGLRRILGDGLTVHSLGAEARARSRAATGYAVGKRARVTGHVLVLSDLGAHARDPAEAERWRTTLAALRLRETSAVVLTPTRVPSSMKVPAIAWGPWQDDDPLAVETLKTLAAAPAWLEPGLLRALRDLVPGATLDAELRVVSDAGVEAADSTGIAFRADALATLRGQMALLPAPVRIAVEACLRAYRVEQPPELVHAETLQRTWTGSNDVLSRQAQSNAVAFAARLAQYTKRNGDDVTWRAYARCLLEPLEPTTAVAPTGDARVALTRVWSAMAHDQIHATPPAWADVRVVERNAAHRRRWWGLRQIGDALVVEPRSDATWPSDAVGPGTPVAMIQAASMVELSPAADAVCRLEDRAAIALPRSALRIADALGTRLLEALPREPWMAAIGQDRYGLWCEVQVAKDVSFRMRWIPPGRFVMGSPEQELGRWDDREEQHEVLLTQGYWLGETPVTQELWRVVMNTRPSHFRGDLRPVEQVTWHDAMAFCVTINSRFPGLALALPTEAEWEYACRAGTTGATWNGDLSNMLSDSSLDLIAWYVANSGGESHDVGTRRANPWGLHDMLGNVMEWCADARDITTDDAVDPHPRDGRSTQRAARGGSWNDGGRCIRGAFRAFPNPYDPVRNVGFRIARGQAGQTSGVAQR